MTRFARLIATGMYLPEIEVPNSTLHERYGREFPESVARLEEATGIRRRWHAPDEMATSDLALIASRAALSRAGLHPKDIDLIVVGTDSPDYITPATSVVLQHKLGATNAGTFDVGCACASFPTGLSAASGIMAANHSIGHALVIGAYLMHRLADPADPLTFFYGDGAGAAVLCADTVPGVIGSAFQADGAYAKHWGIYAGGTVEPASLGAVLGGRTTVRMIERLPAEVNNLGWPRLVRKLADTTGFAVSDIDFVIFTQVRKPSIGLVMDDLGLPIERTHTVMEEWGYTGSACIPMALHDAYDKGLIKPDDLVVLVGSGVGYNQAAVAYRA